MKKTSIDVDNDNESESNCSVEYIHQKLESDDSDDQESDYRLDSPLSPCYENLLREQHPFLQHQKIQLENYLDPFFKTGFKAYSKDCFYDQNLYPEDLISHIKLSDFNTFTYSVLKKSSTFFGTIKTYKYFTYSKQINFNNCVLTLNFDQNEIIKAIMLHILSFTKEIPSNNHPIFHIQKALDLVQRAEQGTKDEIYMQLIKQLQQNTTSSLLYYYQILAVYSTIFAPSKNYYKPLLNYFYYKKENNSLFQTYNYFILRRIYLSYKLKSDCVWLSEKDISKVIQMKPLLFELQLYHFAKFYLEMQLDLTCRDILNQISDQLNINYKNCISLCLVKTTKKITEIVLEDSDNLFKIVKDHLCSSNKIKDIANQPDPSFRLVLKLVKIQSPYQNIEIFTMSYLVAIQDYLNDNYPVDENEMDEIFSLKIAADYGIKRHLRPEQLDINEYVPCFKKNTFDSHEKIQKIIALYSQLKIVNQRDARYKILKILDQFPKFLSMSFVCLYKEISATKSQLIQKIVLNIAFRGLICSNLNDQREYFSHIDYDLILNLAKSNNKTLQIQTLDKQIYVVFHNFQECELVYKLIQKHESQISFNDFDYTNLS